MSHVLCPRQIIFTLTGAPGVEITATEVGGKIEFIANVLDTGGSTGDLRALFFHLADAELAGLTVTSSEPLLVESRVGNNNVLDLGDGANLSGKVKSGFDVGLEWGTPGGSKDDINFPVTFTIQNGTGDLTLDDIGGRLFGAKLDSVGGPGGPRGSSTKLTALAPWAPDAIDDVHNMFEDGAAGLTSPSKTPTAVTIDVLGNDLDNDTPQSAFIIDDIVEGPLHGSIEISPDGKYIYYTPDLDYSGTDSFWYCMSDGAGGQDSAMCTINIAAVADDPLITFGIAQGTHINETLVTVTATQNDADGSEDISSLDWTIPGGLPAGVTITPLGPVAGSGDNLVQQFVVTTAAETDYDFDIDFTALSTEASNADTESHTEAQPIEINFTHNAGTLTYAVDDQSIWDTGDAFTYDLGGPDGFFGIDIPDTTDGDVYEDPVFGVDIAGWDYSYGLTAGFQLDIHIEGGAIDASIPIDVVVDATYNHTTDNIYIDSSAVMGAGGSFLTSGPEGNLSLDFLFDYLFELNAWSDLLPVGIDIGPFSGDFSQNIIDLDTNDSHFDWLVAPGVTVGVEWPHVSVTNDPGTMSGSDLSNPFIYAELDVDAVANVLLGGALSWVDSDPTTESNFEVFDLDLIGGLALLQEFAIALGAGQPVNVVLEDDTIVPMTIGTGLWINNASSHDENGDGIVEFSFDFDPDVELTNATSINVGLEAELAFIRNLDLLVTTVTVYNDDSIPILDVPIEVYGNTFDLAGIGSQSFDFFA